MEDEVAQRLAKIEKMRARGDDPYPVRFDRTHALTDVRAQWDDKVDAGTTTDDTEGEVRRVLAYCGLPFEAECLDFHRNSRPVRTASSEQVRRPIFREGIDQWRHYEPWLTLYGLRIIFERNH